MPALTKVKETGQINKHFYMQKYSDLGQFYGKTHSVSAHFQPTRFIFFFLHTLKTTWIDPRYTLFYAQGVQLSGKVPSVVGVGVTYG